MKKVYSSVLAISLAVFGFLPIKNVSAAQMVTSSISVNGTLRSMNVYAPTNNLSGRPLVISMHGMNQSPEYQHGMAHWDEVADTANILVVYPKADGNTWDIYGGTSDLDFISAVIDEMYEKYDIDLNRVYLSGFSMGGMFTYYALNNSLGDRIAAAAPVSGYNFGQNANSSRPIPIIHHHGTGDDVVYYNPGSSNGMSQEGVKAVINKWVVRNGCSTTPTTTKVNNCSTMDYYGDGENGADVVLVSIPNRGHEHRNDDCCHTTRNIWEFVSQYSLQGKVSDVIKSTPYEKTAYKLPGKIEAENYDLGGEGVAYHDTDEKNKDGAYRNEGVDIGTNGDGYHIGWLEDGEWLNYTINNTQAGKYKFAVNLSNEGNDASFHFQIDGKDVTSVISAKDTKDWNIYDTISGFIEIPAGKHVLTFVVDSRYMNVDWFSFEPYQEPYGGVAHAIPGRIEIEDYDLGADGVAYHDNTADNTLDNLTNVYRSDGVDIKGDKESGYRVGMTEKGEWLEYTINVAAAGEYNWAMRTSTDNSTSAFHLELDDEVVVETTNTINTGDWNVYDLVEGTINLPAGRHVLKLVIDESYFDIDWIEFTSNAITQSIALTKGWNLISINVEADDNSIETIFAEADVEQIKTDEIYWNKNADPMFNTLKTIESGKAYLVYATKAANIKIIGMAAANQNQKLNQGWNMVGCNYQDEQELSKIFGDCQVVRTLDDVWTPKGNDNTITKQKPGNGYFILK